MSSLEEPLELEFLVTDAHGNNFKNTSFDVVSFPSQLRLYAFRDAVKVKNSDSLVGISPSQLRVYKNKTSFDAGEEPLKPRTLLDNTFGTDEENALIVVVPSLSSGMLL